MVDEIAGPRKIRYFVKLLQIVVFGAVISTILAKFLGVTFLEPMWWFVENPMALLKLAGLLSILIAGIKVLKLADSSGF